MNRFSSLLACVLIAWRQKSILIPKDTPLMQYKSTFSIPALRWSPAVQGNSSQYRNTRLAVATTSTRTSNPNPTPSPNPEDFFVRVPWGRCSWKDPNCCAGTSKETRLRGQIYANSNPPFCVIVHFIRFLSYFLTVNLPPKCIKY